MFTFFTKSTVLKVKPYLSLTGAFFLAGSSVVAGKLLSSRFPIFMVSALSLAIALFITIPIILWQEKKIPVLSLSHLKTIFLQSFVGMFLFRIFILYGVKYTSGIQGGIITSTTPVVIGFLAYLFLKEELPPKKLLGVLLTVFGIAVANLVQRHPTVGGGTNPLLGNLLIFGAVIGESLFSIFSKKTAALISPLVQTAWVSLSAFILFLPLGIYEGIHFNFSTIGWSGWVIIFYYGAFVTVVAYILWFKGIAKVPASTAGAFTGWMPVSAALLSCWVLGEKLLINHILSLIMVVIGLFLVSLNRST